MSGIGERDLGVDAGTEFGVSGNKAGVRLHKVHADRKRALCLSHGPGSMGAKVHDFLV